MSTPVPIIHTANPREIVLRLDLLLHHGPEALFANGILTTYLEYEDRSKVLISSRIDFEERGQAGHLPNRELADPIMHNFQEKVLTHLGLSNGSGLGYENEEAEKMLKQVLAKLGINQETACVTSPWTAEDLSVTHAFSYWYTVSTFELDLGGQEMHLGGTRGDARLVTGSIANPNKYREQHQARDDEMQGTIEETEDAPEGSGANITVDLGSKESHLSEPRKDSAIGDQTFKQDILILGKVERLPAVAHLDTSCDAGIWISHRLVCDLGRKAEISPSPTIPQLSDANGNRVGSCGSISLSWRMYHNGTRWHKDVFFVLLPPGDAYDVIFGSQYLLSKDWVSVNGRAMLPMIEHKQKTPDEKKEIASEEDKQRRGKAEIESRRLAAQQIQEQLKHQQSRSQSGQSQIQSDQS